MEGCGTRDTSAENSIAWVSACEDVFGNSTNARLNVRIAANSYEVSRSAAKASGKTFSATSRLSLVSRGAIHLSHPTHTERGDDFVRPEFSSYRKGHFLPSSAGRKRQSVTLVGRPTARMRPSSSHSGAKTSPANLSGILSTLPFCGSRTAGP